MSRVVSVAGNRAFQRLTSSTSLPRSRSTSQTPAAARVPSSSSTTTRPADGALPQQHVPSGQDVVLLDAGQAVDERVDAREAGAARDGTGATTTPSGSSSRCTNAGVASVSSRTSTPKRPSRRSRSVTSQPNSSRAGVRRIRFTWPPSRSARSTRMTSWPRSASVAAAFIPAGPPQATSQRAGGSAARQRAAEPAPATGRRIDRASDRQALEDAPDAALVAPDAVDDLVLAAVAGLVRELGVGDLGAGHRHHVAFPAARISSASAASLIPPTVNTGSDTASFTCADSSTR